MNYNNLIETISEIVNNDKINKNGLSLIYQLNNHVFDGLNQELLNKTNSIGTQPIPINEFEVEIGGILIKFIKK